MVRRYNIQQWPYFIVSVVLALDICDRAVGSNTIVAVSRRQSEDIRYYTRRSGQHCHITCSPDNATYLVAEKQCISNSDLFSECSFAITPTGEPHLLRLTIKTVNGTSRLQTINGTSALNATIVVRHTQQQVNSSLCHISSLAVYRGRDQVIEISHHGFSLSDSGTIEIFENQLGYDPTEYEGELYRMNVSCMNNSMNNCLFFKVTGNTTISDVKFNYTVPGTIQSIISECAQTMTSESDTDDHSTSDLETAAIQSSSPIVPKTSTEEPQIVSISNGEKRLALEIGSPLFYGLVAAGSVIILILLLCVIGVSILACRRGYNTSHTEKEGQPIYEDLDNRNGQILAITNPGYNNNPNTMNGHNDNSVGIAEQDFTSHTYQEIGATYQEIMPMVKDSNQRQVQWGITNPILLQPDSSEESQEYSTLNHMPGGQLKVLNNSHCNGESTIDSEQYAKLNIMDNQLD